MQPLILTRPRTQENIPYIVMDTDDTLVQVSRQASEIQAKGLEMSIASALSEAETEEEAQHILREADAMVTRHMQACIMLDFADRNVTTDNPNTIAYPTCDVNSAGMMQGIAELWLDGSGRN